MLVDKLPWCNHDGHPIFSVHVQPGATRFATGGSDGKAKIWSLASALDAETEIKGSPPLLSTLTEHNGPVNVVRFSHSGRMLATGSDDHLACVFELRPGPATTMLGASMPNLENWRLKSALRGHANNVVDLAWSPDDALLASASLDGTATIWRPGAGAGASPLRRLTAHTSFVKGVAFDPVGSYLATASDDRSVIIWRVEDWSVVAKVTSPFAMMISATFALRCAWSPDGQWLLAGNSFQGATHAAVLLPRERWLQSKECLIVSGHSGAVVSAAFNPRLFTPAKTTENNAIAANGWGGKGHNHSGADDEEGLTSIFAIGSQDRRATVWTAGADRPIFCASHFFGGQILDLAWTPSGYGLLCCSTDGTVAAFQFAVEELGEAATVNEVETLLRSLYGRSGPQSQQKRRLVESVEQLELEEAESTGDRRTMDGQALQASFRPPAEGTIPSTASIPKVAAVLHARLGGESASMGFSPERRGPSTGVTQQQPRRRQAPGASSPTRSSAQHQQQGEAVAALANAPSQPWNFLLPVPPLQREMLIELVPTITGCEGAKSQEEGGISAVQQTARIVNSSAANTGLGKGTSSVTVSLADGKTVRWTDTLPRHVTAAAAVGTVLVLGLVDSSIVLCSPSGRRIVGLLRLGGGPVVRLVTEPPFLLAATASGTVQVWELRSSFPVSVLRTSVSPVFASSTTAPRLAHMGLMSGGQPTVTLSDGSTFVYSKPLAAWMLVADELLSASAQRPSSAHPVRGELAELQRRSLQLVEDGLREPAGRLLAAARERKGPEPTRAHLEASLAAARQLGDINQYRDWLLKYVAFLTSACDETRLQELCADLLAVDFETAEEENRTMEGVSLSLQQSPPQGDILLTETYKRQLLREHVLPLMARERNLQRLTQRYRDALADLDELL